jgi:hypothetical protein
MHIQHIKPEVCTLLNLSTKNSLLKYNCKNFNKITVYGLFDNANLSMHNLNLVFFPTVHVKHNGKQQFGLVDEWHSMVLPPARIYLHQPLVYLYLNKASQNSDPIA